MKIYANKKNMNYLIKNIKNEKRLNIALNTNQKKHKISISSLAFKSNLINQNINSISPIKNIIKNRNIFKIKNYTEENKNNENNTINKSAMNLTSTEMINKPIIYTNYIKKANLNSLNSSNAQPLITGTKVKNVSIPYPSKDIQKKIVSYIDNRIYQIDKVIENYSSSISLLQERKQIIINDVVTGKVKVV